VDTTVFLADLRYNYSGVLANDCMPLGVAYMKAVMDRDYNAMIDHGGNIYFLSKLFSTDKKSFQFAAGSMTGMTQEEYA
jgi:protocatechuate 4,5-dioxygenase alpha chain